MPSTIPELALGSNSTAAAAAFADFVLTENIFGGALPGTTLFTDTTGDANNSESTYSASSWDNDDVLEITGFSTSSAAIMVKQEPQDETPIKQEPHDETPMFDFQQQSGDAPPVLDAAALALKQARELARFDEENDDYDEDDDNEAVWNATEDAFDEPNVASNASNAISSSVTTIGAVRDSPLSSAKQPKKAGKVTLTRTGRRVGRPPRAAAAAAAVLSARLGAGEFDSDFSDSDESRGASNKKNKLKRKAVSQQVQLSKSEQELAATLELSRDELLNMTSESLEQYAQRLAATRPLTVEEQKKFKRQRRLIKNRESAQLSRMRKKAYVDELEKQIADLNAEKEKLRRKSEAQARELDAIKAVIVAHPALAHLALPATPTTSMTSSAAHAHHVRV